ncbi:SRPBCC domain-containing protein [Microbacterium sp. AZCO]|uniref:SRPBCC domain-containing protein n=1 Tax=Microbacterium sp. AZCO TaxID=3142976 RepID=UPI0031F3C415
MSGSRGEAAMTTEHRLAHSAFTLTRDFPVSVERVWRAFAEEDQKRKWLGDADTFERGEWRFDFRVGGRDVDEAQFHGGPRSRYEAVYTDIVEPVRIVTTYDMWLDGIHMSTSVASFEFEEIAGGTRLTHVEHGVFFDQFWEDGPNREEGSRGILESLAAHLA